MALYKATEKGSVALSKNEEKELRALWKANEGNVGKVVKSLEQRVRDLEIAVEMLSK